VTALTPTTAAKVAETCRGNHAADLAASGECPVCGAHADMTEEEGQAILSGRVQADEDAVQASDNLAELMRNAGVVGLPDSGGWLDTGTGTGYSHGTAWERHDDPSRPDHSNPQQRLATLHRVGPPFDVLSKPTVMLGTMDELSIIEVVADEVGSPRNDGTAGSGLYRVPLRLSRTPTSAEAALLVQVWNSPPSFTTMHRPGIASVAGDRFVLNGTTIEEVRDVHMRTLKLVLSETNRQAAELAVQEQARKQREDEQRAAHRRNVENVAADIKFDED
jgi:hypothetical protein